MEPWNKSLNFIFPTKYVIPKSSKFSRAIGQVYIVLGWLKDVLLWSDIRLKTTILKLDHFEVKMKDSSEQRSKHSYFPLYWLVYRDPYIGLLI